MDKGEENSAQKDSDYHIEGYTRDGDAQCGACSRGVFCFGDCHQKERHTHSKGIDNHGEEEHNLRDKVAQSTDYQGNGMTPIRFRAFAVGYLGIANTINTEAPIEATITRRFMWNKRRTRVITNVAPIV